MDQRTEQQNRAIHKYCRLVAEQMNDAGYSDLHTFLTKPCEIPITMDNVKAIMWKPLQKAMLGRESTTKLHKDEVDMIYQTLSRYLAENFDLVVEFPSEETLHEHN